MDDTCAVCAETLEWVAYGSCGHREVCSTCVARLRFICNDRRCCLCKSESGFIFVTKALGDYTRVITDFSVLPADPLVEGQVGPYWYHEDTQAYFDDVDHYKMVKAMCRLSCSACDKEDEGNEGSRRRVKFKNVEQLKGHLFHRHKLLMCSLCLEGRKVFICEQKLYTRAQLNQHINSGDSEVDGSESERGGFTGHPLCEFCRNPFYGDNELYSHMSTEHYTCHICQRQHPGQYEYYKNYDDLEIHFRRDHFLCEDEACLLKKFIVFPSESEMKRHNAKEHGGNMSRSKRNAALRIPTSFRYQRSTEEDSRSRRGRGFQLDPFENQLSMAIQASLGTSSTNASRDTSSSAQTNSNHRETSEISSLINPFASLATIQSETPSRYRQAVGHHPINTPLEEASFPPLPAAPSRSSQHKSKNGSHSLARNSMAARLRHKTNGLVSSSQAWPTTSRQASLSATSTHQPRPIQNPNGLGASPSKPVNLNGLGSSSKPTNLNGLGSSSKPTSLNGLGSSSKPTTLNGLGSSSKPTDLNGLGPSSYAISSRAGPSTSSRVNHSASAPNLVNKASSLDTSNFPPVSAAQTNPKVPKAEDVHTANKSLVERIRVALGSDDDTYAAFKHISGEYRQDLIDTGEYVAYVHQFGLSHLILELARLCPDSKKQKELIEAYNICYEKHKNGSKKGKEKVERLETNGMGRSKDDTMVDSLVNNVKKLQMMNQKPPDEEVEVLSRDGYRSSKGKANILLVDEHDSGGGSKKNVGNGGGSKPKKKIPKFDRVRLGDKDTNYSDLVPEMGEEKTDPNEDLSDGVVPVRGVWRNAGGQRLVALTQRDRSIR